MIGATYPVLAPAGSDQNLSRVLSTVVPVAAESSSATPRHQRFLPWKPITHLPSRRFTRSIPRHQPQNPFNTQRLVPAPFNEFYPKRSGPTFPSLHAISPPEHFR